MKDTKNSSNPAKTKIANTTPVLESVEGITQVFDVFKTINKNQQTVLNILLDKDSENKDAILELSKSVSALSEKLEKMSNDIGKISNALLPN